MRAGGQAKVHMRGLAGGVGVTEELEVGAWLWGSALPLC